MKRIILLVSLILSLNVVFSNPNPVVLYDPQAFISELFFTSDNEWHMEIELWVPEYYLINGVIDSIVIQSNAGKSRWLGWYITSHQLFLINKWNLNDYLYFNPDQDTITILTYLNQSLTNYGDSVVVHQLIYGYPDCEIPSVGDGSLGGWSQSICAREQNYGDPLYFYRDDSPTLGIDNDTQGSVATVSGYFYDHRDSLITYNAADYYFCFQINSEFAYIHPVYAWSPLSAIHFEENGLYNQNVLSRHTNTAYIIRGTMFCPFYDLQFLECIPFEYNLMPGEVISQDIHLTDTNFIVGMRDLPEPPSDNLHVTIAPNPFSDYTNFFIESDHTLAGGEIKIFDIKGRLVKEIRLHEFTKEIVRLEKSELYGSGVYVYAVICDEKLVKTGQLICQ
jgi:hypothetical protein